jgi:vancomycin permeability regulator SanA
MPEAPAGAAIATRAPRRWRVVALVLAVVLGALVAAGNLYLVSTTRAGIVAGPEVAPARPAAIVLGNYVSPRGIPSRELAQRLETGRVLYETKRVERLIVSGLVRQGYDEPGAMRDWLLARGVPPAAIVLDVNGHRTAASMAAAVALGYRSVLVVSQAYHLPRALYFARRAGVDAIGVPAPFARDSTLGLVRVTIRETLARAEAVLEVALRGVQI